MRVRSAVAAVAVAAACALVAVPPIARNPAPPVQETVTNTDTEAEFRERTRITERLRALAGVQPPAVAEAIADRGHAYVLSDPQTGRPLAAISRDGWLPQGPGGGQGQRHPIPQGEILPMPGFG